MDKIIAVMVTIVAVVVIAGVVIFGGLAPAIEGKSETVIGQMDALDYTGN